MPRKKGLKALIEKLPLPKWKNNAAGQVVYLYSLAWIGQLMSISLPYWKIIDLIEPDVIHEVKVFGYEEGYYQEEQFCTFIKFCIFWAMAIDMFCGFIAFKAAKKPTRHDARIQAKTSILGFVGFMFGILSMAMFSPGEKGDKASIGAGFCGQIAGLMLMLGGVILQFECGGKENISPQLRFQMFGGGGGQVRPV